jgi:3-oxoadipate enol-lactonase
MAHAASGSVAIGWEEAGRRDGSAIVLVHSLGTDRSMWEPQVEPLGADHCLLLVDLRGHGASHAPPGPYTLDELAGDVLAVADAAGLDRFHLCGVSIGGLVAQWLAVHSGPRLTSLIAANTAARIGTADAWNARIEAVRAGGMESIRETVVTRWFSPGFATTRPEAFARANQVFASTPPDGYVGCCAALAAADLRDEVGAITVPTLLVGGELDRSTPPVEIEWLHERINGSRAIVIEGAAHLASLDRPAEFNAAVLDFLAAT